MLATPTGTTAEEALLEEEGAFGAASCHKGRPINTTSLAPGLPNCVIGAKNLAVEWGKVETL
jgi:hypothetical protein